MHCDIKKLCKKSFSAIAQEQQLNGCTEAYHRKAVILAQFIVIYFVLFCSHHLLFLSR